MSGLEMRATNGRLTYVRQTISMDEIERGRDEMTQGTAPKPCDLPPKGFFCTRAKGHAGPCATYETAVPTEPLMWDGDVPEPRGHGWAGLLIALVSGVIVVGVFAAIVMGITKLVKAGHGL